MLIVLKLLFQNICCSPFFLAFASHPFHSKISWWNRSKTHWSAFQKEVFKLSNMVDIFTYIFPCTKTAMEKYQSKNWQCVPGGPFEKNRLIQKYISPLVLNNWFMFQVNFCSNLQFYFFNYPFFSPIVILFISIYFCKVFFSCSQCHYAFPDYFFGIKCSVLYLFIINYWCLIDLCFVSDRVIFLFPIF